MLTTTPDGNVWVQESGSNSNAVFDPISLDLVKRIPAGEGPVVASFSPAGKYAYIGHLKDSIVQVVDAGSLTEVKRVSVGTSPSKLAVDPSGKFVYAILTKEASVSVIDTRSLSEKQCSKRYTSLVECKDAKYSTTKSRLL